MKRGWYEKKLNTRWYVYQLENENTTRFKNKNVSTEILKRNDEDWEALEATTHIIRFHDIPWLNKYILTTEYIDKEKRKGLLMRWHPDRFFNSNVGKRIHEDDREKVKATVDELCKIIVAITKN